MKKLSLDLKVRELLKKFGIEVMEGSIHCQKRKAAISDPCHDCSGELGCFKHTIICNFFPTVFAGAYGENISQKARLKVVMAEVIAAKNKKEAEKIRDKILEEGVKHYMRNNN